MACIAFVHWSRFGIKGVPFLDLGRLWWWVVVVVVWGA